MEMDAILTAIGSFGFPVVMCIVVCFYVKYIIDKNSEQLEHITEQHREETKEMTKAIENNTVALTRLLERLNRDE
jgi:hypothetical protein